MVCSLGDRSPKLLRFAQRLLGRSVDHLCEGVIEYLL
jgi:hypothetical protein